MFLDKVRKKISSVSLSWRLSVSTFFISLFILSIAFTIFFHSYRRILAKEYSSQLNGYMIELSTLLEEMQEDEYNAESSVMKKWIHSELTNKHYEAMLIAANDEILDTSDTFPFTYREFDKKVSHDTSKYFWKSEEGVSYILGRHTVYENDKLVGYILVGRNLERETHKQYKIALISALVCFLTSVAMAFLSFIFSRATLSPVRKMSAYINSIEAKNLNKRLNPQEWPQELRPVVNSFDSMLIRLEDNFLRLNQFSSDLAHELRTPLHQLKIAVEVTLSKERSSAEYVESLLSTLENTEKISRLVENILFIARAEKGKTALRLSRVNIYKTAEKIKDFFQVVLEERKINLDIKRALGSITADEQMLTRIFVNIVNNAIRHVKDGGNIIISTAVSDDCFLIAIKNDGGIISPDSLDKLFDRFFKIDSSRTTEKDYPSSGLGLSIAKSIMTLHDGTISARNLPKDKGVVFELKFPFK